MKTKIISSFLILAISIGNLFASVQVGDLYYDLEASTLTAQVTFKSYKSSTWSYNENWSITSASIPSSITYQGKTYQVTSIGDHAFERCGELTSVTIPNTITNIGNETFKYCRGLSYVTIPNSVTNIGNQAFDECSGLTSIIIPDKVISIGEGAFANCSRLTSVTVGSSVTSIGQSAFFMCSSLATIVIGKGVTSIGDGAFKGCTQLTTIIWNAKKCSKNYSSTKTPFYYYDSSNTYTSYDLRDQITSFVFGDEVEYIPAYLCYGMKNLTSITIPNNLTGIGSSAFSGCNGLNRVQIDNIASWCSVTFGDDYSNPIFVAKHLYFNNSEVKKMVIPSGVTRVGASVFRNCSSITSVEIPNSVTTIGESAFEECRNLTSISVGKNVTHIGDRALRGCNKLTSVVWNAINSADCKFPGMEVSPGIYSYIIKTPFYSGNGYASETFNITEQITSFVFGNEVEHIPAYLCYGMSNLSSLIVPNSVTSIGEGAFQGCYGLASIEIPNGITSIEKGTFSYCRSMISFEIPNSVTSIGEDAFHYCTSLASITIPNSVTSIGDYAFWNCTSLTSITIPNSVTSIGKEAFYRCVGLTKVTLGNSVTSIGHQAFCDCTGLTSVTCLSITPATIVWPSFDINLKAIYVPCGSLNTYKNAPEWIHYSSKIQYTTTNISVFSSDETKGTVSYPETLCDAPQILAIPNEGYHFTKWNDGNTNNPRTIDPSEEKTYTASFEINKYQVRFFGYNGTLLSKQSVTHGTSAIAPEAPQVEHYDFIGWDKEYTNVTSNLDVYAIYEKNTEDVDNINFNTQPRKIVVDAQIFILRGDKIYTLTGQEVK